MKVNSNFVLRNIYGEHLLIPVRANNVGDEIIAFNEVGADIWKLAEQRLSENDIIHNMLQSYGLEENSVEEMAIQSFVDELFDRGLLFREEEE